MMVAVLFEPYDWTMAALSKLKALMSVGER